MRMGLHILAATCAAGRGLWPSSVESQGSTVLIDVGQLRAHDIRSIVGSPIVPHSSAWVLLPKNEREAVLEFVHIAEFNHLNRKGARYWVLDVRLGADKARTISC